MSGPPRGKPGGDHPAPFLWGKEIFSIPKTGGKVEKKMMTLEKIKGMNIPVGTPIELTIHTLNNEEYKELGYFKMIHENPNGPSSILIDSVTAIGHKEHNIPYGGDIIERIKEIKILEYKK